MASKTTDVIRIRPSKQVILNLYDYDRVLICIDGLDEAAAHQELLEISIERAVKNAKQQKRRLHVLISTREHSMSTVAHACA